MSEAIVFQSSIYKRLYLPLFCLFVLYSIFSQHSLLVLWSGIVLIMIMRQFLNTTFAPVLLYCFGIQWMEVFAVLPYLDYNRGAMPAADGLNDVNYLIAITLGQILLMTITVGFFLRKIKWNFFSYKEAANKIDEKKVIIAYAACTFLFPIVMSLTRSNASLFQLVQAFAILRKILLLILIFVFFTKETPYKRVIIAILIIEFVLGFVTFFSSFKEVMLFIVLVQMTVNPEIKKNITMKLGLVVLAAVFLLTFWSYVKYDYRAYLNKGSRQQEVSVSTSEALDFLWTRAQNFDKDAFNAGIEISLYRIQYMEEYMIVYQRVPSVIPHTYGENVTNALLFLVTPRSWNHDKQILDPSAKTSYYTGTHHADAAQGTSISMGYFCDLYIDFGLLGMIVPLLLFALLMTFIFNSILKSNKYNTLFTYSLLIAVVMSLGTFESDIIFYLGTIRNYAIVLLIGNRWIFPRIDKYIKAK